MAENNNPNPNPTETLAVIVAEEEVKPKKEFSEIKPTDKAIQVKNIAGFLSILIFILSLPIIASVIWLLYMKDYECEKILSLPKLQIGLGIGMIFISLISNATVILNRKFPVPGFFIVMVPLIFIFTMGLALVGSYKMESSRIMATPNWFKERVLDENYWTNIKSCIYSRGLCDDLAYRSLNVQSFDFSTEKLSSVESGCCKPPESCGMEYVNATYWTRSDEVETEETTSQAYNRDCDTWNNNRTNLCYDCDSCKQGFAEILESKWWRLGVFLILMALLLILAHILLFITVMWEHYNG